MRLAVLADRHRNEFRISFSKVHDMIRALLILALSLFVLGAPLTAENAPAPDRTSTGGAQTLEDIIARQNQQKIDDSFRRDDVGDPNSAAAISQQLGTLGGVSDAEMWRSIRYGSADVRTTAGGDVGKVLIQDGGMTWLSFRAGPLREYGGLAMVGMIVLLVLFYLIRGKIPIGEPLTGPEGHKVPCL